MKDTVLDIAIIGATGTIGEAIAELLPKSGLTYGKVYALASDESVGKRVSCGDKMLSVKAASDFDFSLVKIAFFALPSAATQVFSSVATQAGCVVIDLSSFYWGDVEVPQVVSGVNDAWIAGFTAKRIISVPNAATVALAQVLMPLHNMVGIEAIQVTSCLPVSSCGKRGTGELAQQTAQLLNGKKAVSNVFEKQIAFNVLPHASSLTENGYAQDELDVMRDLPVLLGDPSIRVNVSHVLVPIFYGISSVVNIVTSDKLSTFYAQELLGDVDGIELLDEGEPTVVTESAALEKVFVGRIHEDVSNEMALNLWLVADNIKKSAALNAIDIGKVLEKSFL